MRDGLVCANARVFYFLWQFGSERRNPPTEDIINCRKLGFSSTYAKYIV